MQTLFLTLGVLVASLQVADTPQKADARQQAHPSSYYEGPFDTQRPAPSDPRRVEPRKAEVVVVPSKAKAVYYTPGTYWTPSYYSQYYFPVAQYTYVPAPATYYYGVAAAPAAYSYGVVTYGPKSLPEGYLIKVAPTEATAIKAAPAVGTTYYGAYAVPAVPAVYPGYYYIYISP
jgi:hypothetical protein